MRNTLARPVSRRAFLSGAAAAAAGLMFSGCTRENADGTVEVEIVCYKREALNIFGQLEDKFNAAHDDIHLTINLPADASTIIKTRFVREDYPDIIGIGGDADFASYVDSEILADVSGFKGMDEVQDAYKDIVQNVTYVPMEGIYGVPYVANAAGVLYNVDMFDAHHWPIPTTWDEFMDLCEEIKAGGETLPLYLGYLDTWTILSPWNSITTNLVPADLARQVNAGKAKFSDYYREPAEKMIQLLDYGESGPFAYSYEDACTAFAREQSAMFPCGSFAVPQVRSVAPDMNIGMFAMPSAPNPDDRILVSGVDLQWCVCEACQHKDAALEAVSFLMQPENLQAYIDDQMAIPCVDGDFTLPSLFDGVREQLEAGQVLDYLDHSYPASMAVDAQLQTMLINKDVDAFLEKFDTDWQRYNRDVIRKVQDYESEQG